MSVEETKSAIMRCVTEIEGHLGKQLTAKFWDEVLDVLILEVQAAMPCYVWKELQPGSRPCECLSCTARTALAKVSA